MSKNQVSEKDLENVSGGATRVIFDYSNPNKRQIARVVLDENASRFLKKRGYTLKTGANSVYCHDGEYDDGNIRHALGSLIDAGYVVVKSDVNYDDGLSFFGSSDWYDSKDRILSSSDL